jgi:hypothetical protein
MSNKINKFRENMIQWIEYENSINSKEKELHNREIPLKELKKKQQEIEYLLINFIESNRLNNKQFNVENMRISYHVDSKKEPLTQKFIKESLEIYFRDKFRNRLNPSECENKANDIFQYMLDLRKSKYKSSLKKITIK